MKKLEKEELQNINGGVSGWVIAGLGALAVFIAGVIDGIARPRKCHS